MGSNSKYYEISRHLYEIVTLLGFFISFIPQIVSNSGPRNYSSNDATTDSINSDFFIHSLLVAVTVAITLAFDGALDVAYGTRFISIINKPRWLLLFALGVPNAIMYFAYVHNTLKLGKEFVSRI